jgi:hypothetical protein
MSTSNGSDGRSLAERILATVDMRSEIVETPEWGEVTESLEVRSMTGLERAGMLEQFMGPDGELDVKRLYPSLLVACVFDPETGEKVFTADMSEQLNGKNAAVLERLAQAAMRLSGMTQAAADELGKGSSEAESVGSTST